MRINMKIVRGNSEMFIEGEMDEFVEKIDAIIKLVDKTSALSASGLPGKMIDSMINTNMDLTPIEILRQSVASTTVDKIMVMIYYQFKHGVTLVNVKDMSELFSQVMEPQPSNWGTMMNHLSSKGWLMGGQKKDNIKAWSLTRTGLKYVEEDLLRTAERPTESDKPSKV